MLNRAWVDRLFERLQGVYGQQFTGKFSKIVGGVDVGVENAKQAWADELSGFEGNGDAIAYAIQNMPSSHCPNALEFKDLCRKAPKKEVQSLPHKLTEEEKQKNAEQAKAFKEKASSLGAKDFHDWAKRPRSQLAFNEVLKLAEQDISFRNYVMNLEMEGHSRGRTLVNRWNGNDWERV